MSVSWSSRLVSPLVWIPAATRRHKEDEQRCADARCLDCVRVWRPVEMSGRIARAQPQSSEVICLDSDDEAVRAWHMGSSCCEAPGSFIGLACCYGAQTHRVPQGPSTRPAPAPKPAHGGGGARRGQGVLSTSAGHSLLPVR